MESGISVQMPQVVTCNVVAHPSDDGRSASPAPAPSFPHAPPRIETQDCPKAGVELLVCSSAFVLVSHHGPDLIDRLKQEIREEDTDAILYELRPFTTMTSFPASTSTWWVLMSLDCWLSDVLVVTTP